MEDPVVAKITVNGVTYDSIHDMPPDVRLVYDQTLANLPDLADRDGDGIPDVVRGESLTVRNGVTVHKQIIVNGTTYTDVNAMPPEARQAYEKATSAMRTGDPIVKKNVVNVSFQIGGPGFSFHAGRGKISPSQAIREGVESDSSPQPVARTPMMSPIEPSSSRTGLGIVLLLGICIAGALVLWFSMGGH
jgi:hypothetical protein